MHINEGDRVRDATTGEVATVTQLIDDTLMGEPMAVIALPVEWRRIDGESVWCGRSEMRPVRTLRRVERSS